MCQSTRIYPNAVHTPLRSQTKPLVSVWETLYSYSRFLTLRFPFCKRRGWRGEKYYNREQTVQPTEWWTNGCPQPWHLPNSSMNSMVENKTVRIKVGAFVSGGCCRWAWHIIVAFTGNLSLISTLQRRRVYVQKTSDFPIVLVDAPTQAKTNI